MMTFKERLLLDLNVFFDTDEFAKEATFIESGFENAVRILYDENLAEDAPTTSVVITAITSEVETLSKDSHFLIDDVKFGIIAWKPDLGMTEILIQRV